MFTKIKKLCFTISTLGVIGELRFGGLAASLFALPLLYLFKGISSIRPNLYYILLLSFTAIVALVIHFALRYESDKDPSSIVLDKIFGFFLVFIGIPFSFKFFIVGFILYHFMCLFRPLMLLRLLFPWFRNVNLNALPGVLGVLAGDFIAGLTVNIFFHLALWLAN